MEADKSLVSGSMALLVLKLLEDGDKLLELAREIEKQDPKTLAVSTQLSPEMCQLLVQRGVRGALLAAAEPLLRE